LPEEKKLAETLTAVRSQLPTDEKIGSEMEHFRELAALRDPLHEFFAKVFVMDPDTIVRDNRLGLLNAVYGLLSNIMDFSKVEIVTKDK
jgi:glycyl-tRNA synthetase beta chain